MFKDAVINFFVNGEQATKQLNDIKNKFSKAGNDIQKSFLGKVGGIGAGLLGLGFIKEVYSQTKKLGDFSQKFKLPVEQVSKFNNMLALFGGSSDTAINDLQSIQQAIIDFKTTGSGALKTVSSQIGLSMYNMDGSIKNSIQIMDDLRGKFRLLNKEAQIKVAQELGISDPATLRLLRASNKEYSEMLREAKNMTLVTEKEVKQVLEVSRLLAKIRQSLYGIGASLLPAISEIVDKIAVGFEKFNSLSDGTKQKILLLAGALSQFLMIGSLIRLGLIPALVLTATKISAITAAFYGAYKAGEWLGDLFANKALEYFMNKKVDVGGMQEKELGRINKERKKRGMDEISWDKFSEAKEKMKSNEEEASMWVKKGSANDNNEKIFNDKSSTNNNNKSSISNVFNFSISAVGSIGETENMINRIIKQNSTGVQY